MTLIIVVLLLAGCMGARPAALKADPDAPISTRNSRSGEGSDDERPSPAYDTIDLFWGNRTHYVVLDRAFQWHDTSDPRFFALYFAVQGLGPPCVWQTNRVYFSNRQVEFDRPSQIVWPGTQRIDVTLHWNITDSAVDRLALGYKKAFQANYTQSPFIERAQTYQLPVSPEDWDSPFAQRTGWDFHVCVNTNTSFRPASLFWGKVHVKMTLVRGNFTEPAPEPSSGTLGPSAL